MSFEIQKFAHVGLTVSDIERSIRLFTETLGCELSRRAQFPPPFTDLTGVKDAHLQTAILSVGQPPVLIELLQYTGPGREHAGSIVTSSSNIGSSHVAFTITNLNEAVEKLDQAGVKLVGGPRALSSGPLKDTLVVYMRDWDGHTYELMQPPER